MAHVESKCTRCGETFLPNGPDPEDMVHTESFETGEDCGGLGVVQGVWRLTTEEGVDVDFNHLLELEKHAVKMPNCTDPDCEFHHPEVRES